MNSSISRCASSRSRKATEAPCRPRQLDPPLGQVEVERLAAAPAPPQRAIGGIKRAITGSSSGAGLSSGRRRCAACTSS
jgi:hypothetical protein